MKCGPIKRLHAFTLIELLVVVGVLVLLMGLIIPSLIMARNLGRSAQCTSNVRELAKDYQGYLNDHLGRPMGWDNYQTFWVDQLRPYGNIDRTRFCPVATSRTNAHQFQDGTLSTPSGYGSTTEAWGSGVFDNNVTLPPNLGVGSYGMNWYCYNQNQTPFSPTWTFPITMNPATIPLFADCMWVDGGPDCGQTLANQGESTMTPAYGPYGIPGVGGSPCGVTGSVVRFCLLRHGRAINMVFMDGHTQLVPLEKLLMFNWHPGYANTTTLLAVPN